MINKSFNKDPEDRLTASRLSETTMHVWCISHKHRLFLKTGFNSLSPKLGHIKPTPIPWVQVPVSILLSNEGEEYPNLNSNESDMETYDLHPQNCLHGSDKSNYLILSILVQGSKDYKELIGDIVCEVFTKAGSLIPISYSHIQEIANLHSYECLLSDRKKILSTPYLRVANI